jgi:hypothetical protein
MVVDVGFCEEKARLFHREDHLIMRLVYETGSSARRSSSSTSEGKSERLAYKIGSAIFEWSRDDSAIEYRDPRSSERTLKMRWRISTH